MIILWSFNGLGYFKFDNNKVKFDAIYNIIHGSPGETGEFSSLLEKIGIPQTSCSSKICELTFDKHEYIKFINSLNLKAAKQFFIKKGKEYNVDDIIINANISEVGYERSFGVMVNYLYELRNIEKNHEEYMNNNKVIVSDKIKKYL